MLAARIATRQSQQRRWWFQPMLFDSYARCLDVLWVFFIVCVCVRRCRTQTGQTLSAPLWERSFWYIVQNGGVVTKSQQQQQKQRRSRDAKGSIPFTRRTGDARTTHKQNTLTRCGGLCTLAGWTHTTTKHTAGFLNAYARSLARA